MTNRFSVVILVFVFGVSALYAGKGKVRIASDQEGAYIYVDGKKKAMTGEGFTSVLLESGEYTVKVANPIDNNYEYAQSKKVFIGEDSSIKISFKLKRKMTVQGKEAEAEKQKRWQRSSEIVTDTKLGLMWQDDSRTKSTLKSWKSAKKYCQNLSLGAYNDWRLPSYEELISIADYDRTMPAIMPSFKNVMSDSYWMVNETVSDDKYAWFISFDVGSVYNDAPKSNEYYVRCIRSDI